MPPFHHGNMAKRKISPVICFHFKFMIPFLEWTPPPRLLLPKPLMSTYLFSISVILSFLECYINRIMQYATILRLAFGLVFFTQLNAEHPFYPILNLLSLCLSDDLISLCLHAHVFISSYHDMLQLCLTLCDPVDCSPPGSSAQGIPQARILEWAAMFLFYLWYLSSCLLHAPFHPHSLLAMLLQDHWEKTHKEISCPVIKGGNL